MRRPLSLVTLLLAGAVAAAALPAPAWGAPAPQAKGSWSMVPQSKDTNDDGVIDGDGGVPVSGALSTQPASRYKGAGNYIAQPNERLIGGALSWYLSPKGFPVALDACRSVGTEFRWVIRATISAPITTKWRPLRSSTCDQELVLPEGPHRLTLEVRAGGRTARESLGANVRNILIVAMGDSYASGEGNPRNVEAWLNEGPPFTPYWDDDACNRSVLGAPAQAALALEERSTRTSVTLVNVTCTGATVNRGILGVQSGQGQTSTQLEQATQIISGHEADLVLLTIGGNDVGFTSVLQACALSNNCPLTKPPAGVLQPYPTVQSGVQARTGQLPADFDRIASCLGTDSCTLKDGRVVPGLPTSPDARVLPTLYPDITRAANGQPCSYLTLTPSDFGWARSTMLLPDPPRPYPYVTAAGTTVPLPMDSGSLNQVIAATARIPGWQPVTGTWAASGQSPEGHGVCAGDSAWVFGVTTLAGFGSASFHPNPTGQRVMGRAIAEAIPGR
jgi:lysophospholipase L1-like esterase